MNTNAFGAQSPGHLVEDDGALAFVPDPLPRRLQLSPELVYLLDEASRSVAMLAGAGEWLPNPYLLIRPFLRREAVLSSRIEGTQASVSDVLLLEAGGQSRSPDAQEVSNYVRALDEGRAALSALPISTRLIRDLHRTLMTGVRGEEKRPGELRDRQVYIGPEGSPIEEARFVPPPFTRVPDLLADWERFVHDDAPLPPLVRTALMHYQFETIHPFNDGNGRIGRLLIPLLLIERDVLPTPLLYLSAYFEGHRTAYYDHLLAVSTTGDWDPWLDFFLRGVIEASRDAGQRVRQLHALHDDFRRRLQSGRTSGNALQLVDELVASPMVTAPLAARMLGVTPPAARALLERLTAAGIVHPFGEGRPQLYVAPEVLALLEA